MSVNQEIIDDIRLVLDDSEEIVSSGINNGKFFIRVRKTYDLPLLDVGESLSRIEFLELSKEVIKKLAKNKEEKDELDL